MGDGDLGRARRVRGQAWDERRTSVLLPSASALGAMWTRNWSSGSGGCSPPRPSARASTWCWPPRSTSTGVHWPAGTLRCFSEDPELTGRPGAALIRGIQALGVAATAKHYVRQRLRDRPADRRRPGLGTHSARGVPRAPREQPSRPACGWSLAGYNAVGGTTMTASPLLAEPLKGQWGFDGVAVSDWAAVRTTEETGRRRPRPGDAGPGQSLGLVAGAGGEGRPGRRGCGRRQVRRLLRLAGRVGALEPRRPRRPRRVPATASRDTRALLRAPSVPVRSCCATTTSCRPTPPGCPASRSSACTPRPRASRAAAARGVFCSDVVTPLAGVRARLRGRARVVYEPGPAPGPPPAPPAPTGAATRARAPRRTPAGAGRGGAGTALGTPAVGPATGAGPAPRAPTRWRSPPCCGPSGRESGRSASGASDA
ncbi:hypothetical protein LV779_02020 [Streptomyces thinghirensis]|nr:hypothetical protein [Streptomyces thinghirensis]